MKSPSVAAAQCFTAVAAQAQLEVLAPSRGALDGAQALQCFRSVAVALCQSATISLTTARSGGYSCHGIWAARNQQL